ncbi:hypothetical protein [Actinoplanes campanulatus]|uniref:hypothetical protein n=1 Tax=Actinoplanes campanulatus TaxID=113559 RepID=UPI0019534BE6|nr:hypothetical protein [Actinoplanes capillaceus]
MRSEWIKFWSLRAPVAALAVLVVLNGGLAAMLSLARARQWDGGVFDPVQVSLAEILMTQIAAAVLGLIVINAEIGAGTIRSTLAAIPRRSRVLAAKLVITALTVLVTGTGAAVLAFVVGQTVLAGQLVPTAGPGDPGVSRAVFGAGLYLTAAAVIGLAVGVLVRSAPGGVAIVMTGLLIVPIFANALPEAAARWILKFWPSVAGLRVISTTHDANLLSPWAGFAVMAATALTLLATAFLIFRHRDM